VTIDTLIDRPDNFEVVRDKIAQILANETAAQQALAALAAKDETLWAFTVLTERAEPIDRWQESGATRNEEPAVVVWYDSDVTDGNASNPVSRQTHVGQFNIDCYAPGYDEDTIKADENAARNAQRIMRLVRSILMAAEYTYLELRGIVGRRRISNRQMFSPRLDNNATPQIIAGRLVLEVRFDEAAPQVSAEVLEFIAVDIKRAEDGSVLAEADFDYT
jgi:hypothetical protein